ncbi:alpha/beta-hydrolase [Lentithecium fluviatile CBS 122367]|uniref:Alpha/beta-hydrolase n=1 Tax=Lentithecium fluviatile CBS 122367 TaxID=1168545 RepID=A0A6G1ICH8_9PLEO|nr:alpha/beta-hydrolase [Lentithecium fluviatile CBS 122367]
MATASASPSPAGDSIQLTTRHDRSLYTYIIQVVTRPLRNYLGRPGKEQPEGSIQLTPHKSAYLGCAVDHRTVCGMHVYDIISKMPAAQEVRKRIYYFSGGGWQSPPSSQHWHNCAKMARDVPGTTVSLVSYPLAPRNAAPTAFPWLMRFYRQVLETAYEEQERVVFVGDSSGANIVLSLVLEAVREDASAGANIGVKGAKGRPEAVVAICPSTDLTRSNPDIEKLAKCDPILTPKFVRQTAKAWHADWDPADRRVSPVNADIALLAQSGIQVHGITSSYDILSPDGIIFRDRLAKEGVHGKWLHWEMQMHCFVLTQAYGVREAKEAIDWVMDVLKAE